MFFLLIWFSTLLNFIHSSHAHSFFCIALYILMDQRPKLLYIFNFKYPPCKQIYYIHTFIIYWPKYRITHNTYKLNCDLNSRMWFWISFVEQLTPNRILPYTNSTMRDSLWPISAIHIIHFICSFWHIDTFLFEITKMWNCFNKLHFGNCPITDISV